MAKSIKKNYIYNLIYQVLLIIVPFFTTPYLSRVLGAEKIGIYSYTLSITTYFILFGSLGVAMYGQREIAYLQNNKYERSKTFFEILLMRFFTLGISLCFFYLFIVKGKYEIYFKILLLEIISNSLDISWFFQGLEEFKKTVIRNSLVRILSVICIFIFVKTSNDLIKYFFIYVLSALLGNITLWFYLPKYIKKVKISDLKIFRHLKPTFGLFIPQIAIQVYTVLDKTMIGSIIDDKSEVGFYEQAQKVMGILLTIVTSLGTVMVPRMANIFASGDKEKLNDYIKKSFQFVLFLAFPVMFGIISVSNKFVPLFFGQGYDKVIYIINVISPIILFIGISNVIGTQYLLPTKQQRRFTISVTVGAIVNFVLNMIFIRYWKSLGASIATVVAEFSVTSVQLFLVRKEIDLKNIFKISIKYLISSLIMFVLCVWIGNIVNRRFWTIAAQVATGGITYMVLLLIMKDSLIFEAINIIKQKIKG